MADKPNLFDLVIAVDDQLIQEGLAPFQRPLHACMRIADQLGISFVMAGRPDPFVEDVHRVYKHIYREEDLYMPALFVGAFMFRDVFYPIRIPVMYGTPAINPVQFLQGIPEFQKQWLFSKEKDGLAYFDQVIDLCDFVYSLDDMEKTEKAPPKAVEYWQLARQQIEAAAATLMGSFDRYAAIQNCIIACELLAKGALLTAGLSAKQVRGFGHDVSTLAREVAAKFPAVDGELLIAVADQYPGLIERRYEAKRYKRIEIGRLMMNTQFVAGEVLRQFSDRNMRAGSKGDNKWDVSKRTFPERRDEPACPSGSSP